MKKKIISIDGPAASGKGKIAKYISRKWKYTHLDSGILYRKLAYFLLKNKIDHKSLKQLKKIITKKRKITFRKSQILRKEEILIPRSNSKFEKNDTVVFLCKSDQIALVENIFRISSI